MSISTRLHDRVPMSDEHRQCRVRTCGRVIKAGGRHMSDISTDTAVPVERQQQRIECDGSTAIALQPVILAVDDEVLYATGHIDRLMDARLLWDGEAFLAPRGGRPRPWTVYRGGAK